MLASKIVLIHIIKYTLKYIHANTLSIKEMSSCKKKKIWRNADISNNVNFYLVKILPRTILKETFKLQVTKHKSDFKGTAIIGLSLELWLFVQKYIHLIRRLPNFVFKISDFIFLKWPPGGASIATRQFSLKQRSP